MILLLATWGSITAARWLTQKRPQKISVAEQNWRPFNYTKLAEKRPDNMFAIIRRRKHLIVCILSLIFLGKKYIKIL
jgi:hypothetical protein